MELYNMSTTITLNLLLLGLYDVLIDMYWLVAHRTKVDCYNKFLECLSDEGEEIILQGIKKYVFVRKILALQVKRCNRKGCTMFVVQVTND